MHLSLSSIGGTREEQLCILSAVCCGESAWLFTVVRRARRITTSANDNNLEAPLLEEDEPKHAIRSACACCQSPARLLRPGRTRSRASSSIRWHCCGRAASERRRLYRAAGSLRAVADRRRQGRRAAAPLVRGATEPGRCDFCGLLGARGPRDARLRREVTLTLGAELMGALCARGLARGCHRPGDKATPRERTAVARRECSLNCIRSWASRGRGPLDRKAVLKDENLAAQAEEINQ